MKDDSRFKFPGERKHSRCANLSTMEASALSDVTNRKHVDLEKLVSEPCKSTDCLATSTATSVAARLAEDGWPIVNSCLSQHGFEEVTTVALPKALRAKCGDVTVLVS